MSSGAGTVDHGAERSPLATQKTFRAHASRVCLGIVLLIVGLSGCDALLDVFGGGPAGAGLPVDGNDIHVTIKNQSGFHVNLEASFHINGQLTRETLRLLPAEGIEATTQIVWTLTDRILLTARVAQDSPTPPNAQIQPGEILAEQEFVLGVDFQADSEIEFIIPSPPPPPAQIIDCNHNGIADAVDIANLTSTDCNASGIPDECELEDNDCNHNTIPDECDIASGFSEDCLPGTEPRSHDNIEPMIFQSKAQEDQDVFLVIHDRDDRTPINGNIGHGTSTTDAMRSRERVSSSVRFTSPGAWQLPHRLKLGSAT